MRTVTTRRIVPGATVGQAHGLWFDLNRWPSFVDGFYRPARIDGEWPQASSGLLWDSLPGGRGRVLERVTDFEPGAGQRVHVEDEQLVGFQRVAFAAVEGGCEVTLELSYELKRSGVGGALTDVLFVRRALGDSLRRTLKRFAVELQSDCELGVAGAS